MRLNVPKINVATLTPEGFSIQDEAMDVSRSAPQGAHYHVDVIYLTSITGNKEGSKGLMVLRVKPTPTRFPTNSLHSPITNAPSHSILSVCAARGVTAVVVRYIVAFR